MASVWSSLSFRYCGGSFAGSISCPGTTDTFLGLRFVVSGKTYYGWAGFSIVKLGFNGNREYLHARLVGVAYEDVPNQPIRAGQLQDGTAMIEAAPDPQPATLGLLALGAPGLPFWGRSAKAQQPADWACLGSYKRPCSTNPENGGNA
jgi:hypothetical protein